MKKKKIKIYRQLAGALPEIFEGKALYFSLVGHERNRKGQLTGRLLNERRQGIRVNHVRRIKRAHLRDGIEGIGRYLDKVREYERETKSLMPLIEQQQ